MKRWNNNAEPQKSVEDKLEDTKGLRNNYCTHKHAHAYTQTLTNRIGIAERKFFLDLSFVSRSRWGDDFFSFAFSLFVPRYPNLQGLLQHAWIESRGRHTGLDTPLSDDHAHLARFHGDFPGPGDQR